MKDVLRVRQAGQRWMLSAEARQSPFQRGKSTGGMREGEREKPRTGAKPRNPRASTRAIERVSRPVYCETSRKNGGGTSLERTRLLGIFPETREVSGNFCPYGGAIPVRRHNFLFDSEAFRENSLLSTAGNFLVPTREKLLREDAGAADLARRGRMAVRGYRAPCAPVKKQSI